MDQNPGAILASDGNGTEGGLAEAVFQRLLIRICIGQLAESLMRAHIGRANELLIHAHSGDTPAGG